MCNTPWILCDMCAQQFFLSNIFLGILDDLLNGVHWLWGENIGVSIINKAWNEKIGIIPFFLCYSPWILCDMCTLIALVKNFQGVHDDLLNRACWFVGENISFFHIQTRPKMRNRNFLMICIIFQKNCVICPFVDFLAVLWASWWSI